MTDEQKICDCNGASMAALELEDRRRQMEDSDLHRDQTRRMAWFCLYGMLGYPALVILSVVLSLQAAADALQGLGSVYFISVAGIVSAFMVGTQIAKKQRPATKAAAK